MSIPRLAILGFLGFSAVSALALPQPAQAAVNGFGDQVASIGYFAPGSGAGFDDPQAAMTVADSNAGAALNAIAPAAGGPVPVSVQGPSVKIADPDNARASVQK
jgi:hypothetical protein